MGVEGLPRTRPRGTVAGALGRAPLAEPALLLFLAVLTGAVGGIGAVAFRLMISACQWFFATVVGGGAVGLLAPARPVLQAITPALGLLAAGVISNHLAREVKGHGVPQILESLALHGGRLRPRVGLFGILAPAITIGAGGSVGREGPIALIGAAFGSALGQLLRRNDTYTALLLACGAAAGIAATFNAPIAGALFGLEVVLGSFAMGALVPVFVSALTGVLVFGAILGDRLAITAPAYAFAHPADVAWMLPLGVLGGLTALAYTGGLTLLEEGFARLRLPWGPKAALGGLAVGCLGLALPGVLGVGYGDIAQAVLGHDGLALLLALLAGKYLATLVTIGAGGSGGVFAPSLVLGAMLGGAFGDTLHLVLPQAAPVPALFAIAGMGVVFAGAAQAPLTAIVIILEMTGDYHLTAGVAGACVISYLLYGSLARDSMYTVRLSRRGLRIIRGAEVRPLQRVPITAALRPLSTPLLADVAVTEARARMAREACRALPVFRPDRTLVGIVDDGQLLRATEAGELQRGVGEICKSGVPILSPGLSLDDAMRRFGLLNTDLLPVGAGPQQVIGTVSRDDALRVYAQRTLLTLETQAKVALLRDPGGAPADGTFREVPTPPAWPGAGVTIAELDLPPGVVIVSIRRGQRSLAPRGETALAAGDGILLYAPDPAVLDPAQRAILAATTRPRGVQGELALPATWPGAQAALRDIGPLLAGAGGILVCIRRGEGLIIPHGETRLRGGDTLTLCATSARDLRAVQALLLDLPPPETEP